VQWISFRREPGICFLLELLYLQTVKSIEFFVYSESRTAWWRPIALLACLFWLVAPAKCGDFEPDNASPLAAFSAIFDTLMGHHYAAADSLCLDMEVQFSDHAAVPYARASVIYAQLCDLEDTLGTGKLESEVERCLALCDEWEADAPDSAAAEREFLVGSAYSLSGLTRHRQGKVVDGISRLMTSRRHFDRAIKLDPEFYDAYVGRGAYRYAAASNLGILRWLPGVPTKRAGWADLKLGLDSSEFSSYSAMSAMVWLAIGEENWVTVDSMTSAGLSRFPNSRTFLMPKLAREKRTAQWAAARETALKLLDSYLNLKVQNGYEVIGLYRSLMDCSDMLGDSAAAEDYARLGLSAAATPYALERRAATLAAMRERLDGETPR